MRRVKLKGDQSDRHCCIASQLANKGIERDALTRAPHAGSLGSEATRMNDRIKVEIPIVDSDLGVTKADLIANHAREFYPLFERLINCGDARITVLDDSLTVVDVDVSGLSGCASVTFGSDFYAGCKDMNSIDEHETTLEFEIIDDKMVFDIVLPPAWIPEC